MTPLADAGSLALLHFIWQGAAIAAMLAVMLRAMRGCSAPSRYLVACGTLVILTLLPVFTTWLLYGDAPPVGLAMRDSRTEAVVPSWLLAESVTGSASGLVRGGQTPANWRSMLAAIPVSRLLQPWVVPMWAMGVFFYSLRALSGWRSSRLLSRSGRVSGSRWSEAVTRLSRSLGLSKRVQLLVSTMVDVPCVAGFLRPVILLPAATLAGMTTLQLEAVIAHELAHIYRYDHWVNLGQVVVETVLFYHPAVWWASSKIREERELCCDDLAVAVCGDAVCYARALTAIEKLRGSQRELVLASNGGALLQRIARITGQTAAENRAATTADTARAAVAVLFAIAVVPASVLWARVPAMPTVSGAARTSLTREASVQPNDLSTSGPIGVPRSSRFQSAPQPTVLLSQAPSTSSSVTAAKPVTNAAVPPKSVVLETAASADLEAAYSTVMRDMGYELGARFFITNSGIGPDPEKSFPGFTQEISRLQSLHQIVQDAATPTARAKAASALRAALKDVEVKFAAVREQRIDYQLAQRPDQMRDRTVRRVTIFDVATKQGELLSKIPIQAGQTLTDEAISQAFRVLQDFDPNLRMLFVHGDGRQVDLIIAAKPVELAINQ